ncbi:hypothetical protein [Breznakiella homolactica]|uniref:GLUG domain-containing protein n=1 Tax=Breznakiella homolactica TaxID=2798577 RepID=A0A7T8B9W3_9SPIR|nr:hypothetical protein [Breznakiella homolactica]QQO10039.1 hypothetical protein JFL75_03745 [Breznakiella homolactica]
MNASQLRIFCLCSVFIVIPFLSCSNPAGSSKEPQPAVNYTLTLSYNGTEKSITVSPGSVVKGSQGFSGLNDNTVWGMQKNGNWIAQVTADGLVFVPIPVNTDEILLSGKDDLSKIGNDPEYPMTGTYILVSDIDLKGEQWIPIGYNAGGSSEDPFKGKLYGNGHTIKGLNLGGTISDNLGRGLFGHTSGAYIENLNIVLIDTPIEIEKCYYLGALVGYSRENDTFDRISVSGKMIITISPNRHSFLNIGGIVGYGSSTVLTNSCSSAEMEVTHEYPPGGSSYLDIGGLAGSLRGSIEKSFFSGNIKAVNKGYDVIAGGILGSGECVISDCYSLGKISAVCEANYTYIYNVYAGGIAGRNNSSINTSYSTGSISAAFAAKPEVAGAGGIAGINWMDSSEIINCVALNDEISSGHNTSFASRIVAINTYDGPLSGNLANNAMIIKKAGNTIPATPTGANTMHGADETLSNLKNQSAYSALSWNFPNTWIMDTRISEYPILRWQVE